MNLDNYQFRLNMADEFTFYDILLKLHYCHRNRIVPFKENGSTNNEFRNGKLIYATLRSEKYCVCLQVENGQPNNKANGIKY